MPLDRDRLRARPGSRSGVTRFSRSEPDMLAGPLAQPIRMALSMQAARRLLSRRSQLTDYHPALPVPQWRAFFNQFLLVPGHKKTVEHMTLD